MTDIVHEGRCKCDMGLVLAEMPCTVIVEMLFDYLHQLPRRVEHANAMRKSRMSSPRKHEFREAKLPYAPQSLKGDV